MRSLQLTNFSIFAIALFLLATLGAGAVVMGGPEFGTGMAALGGALTTSGVLGWHMTASIGGADMPGKFDLRS